MEDSGAILCQISIFKDMLDQVNEEIESNIQITREIESEIVKCSEIGNALAARESELTKTLYVAQFELTGLISVTDDLKNSVEIVEKELHYLRMKRDQTLNQIKNQRERFIGLCLEFQKGIESGDDNEVCALLLEKEVLVNEIHLLEEKNSSLKNSMLAFVEGILEDLDSCNSALQVEIQSKSEENEKLLKDIDNMKTSLLSTIEIDDIREQYAYYQVQDRGLYSKPKVSQSVLPKQNVSLHATLNCHYSKANVTPDIQKGYLVKEEPGMIEFKTSLVELGMKMKSTTNTVEASKRRIQCKGFCGFLQEGRARLYIFRRCIVMPSLLECLG